MMGARFAQWVILVIRLWAVRPKISISVSTCNLSVAVRSVRRSKRDPLRGTDTGCDYSAFLSHFPLVPSLVRTFANT